MNKHFTKLDHLELILLRILLEVFNVLGSVTQLIDQTIKILGGFVNNRIIRKVEKRKFAPIVEKNKF